MSENFKFFFEIGVVVVVGWFAWKLRNMLLKMLLKLQKLAE